MINNITNIKQLKKAHSKYSNKTFYKITNKLEIHNGFKYNPGLNILTETFIKTPECGPGGLYFTDKKNIKLYYDLGVYIREVEIPKDAQVVALDNNNKYKADKLILKKRYTLYSAKTQQLFRLLRTPFYLTCYLQNSRDKNNIKKLFIKKSMRYMSPHIVNNIFCYNRRRLNYLLKNNIIPRSLIKQLVQDDNIYLYSNKLSNKYFQDAFKKYY